MVEHSDNPIFLSVSAAASQLEESIAELWALGHKSLVAWRPSRIGIEILLAPYEVIVARAGELDRLLRGPRHMGPRTFEAARLLTGAEPIPVPLSVEVSETSESGLSVQHVERMLRRYAVTETSHRAVGLLDIVGFSRLKPMYQVAQLNSLQYSLTNAHGVLQKVGIDVDLARSTTGDGYYVWNRDKGLRADLAAYLVMLLTSTDNALAQRALGPELVPNIRSCFSIGSHFSYHQVERLRPAEHRYIVGEVTITLARLMDRCLPGQILIGDFRRPVEGLGQLSAVTFATRAASLLGKLPSARLRGELLQGARCYLTGRRHGDRRFGISRFLIRDKHGFEHSAYNQKFNVYLHRDGAGPPAGAIYLGRQHSELAEFGAEEMPVSLEPS